MKHHQQRRADEGNRFINFAIRAMHATRSVTTVNGKVFVLLEHPEDLGRVHTGEPASIWQLEDIRNAFGNAVFAGVAGHQCQYPEVDYVKPTRLYGNFKGLDKFGHPGWPIFHAAG